MASIYGPNAKYYMNGLEAAFLDRERQYAENEKNRGRVKSAYEMGKKLHNYLSPAISVASTVPVGAMPTIGGGTLAIQSPSLLTGAGSLTGAPSTAMGSLGSGATLTADTGLMSSGVASGVTAPVSTGGTTLGAGSAAGVGLGTGPLVADAGIMAGGAATGVAAPVATGTGTALATSGSAMGTASSGMAATGIGAIIAAGLAIASSKPGDTLFGTKHAMYNYGLKQMSQGASAPNIALERGIFGNSRTGNMGNHMLTGNLYGATNWLFGDPNEQLAEQQRREAEKHKLTALRQAFNIQKAQETMLGQEGQE